MRATTNRLLRPAGLGMRLAALVLAAGPASGAEWRDGTSLSGAVDVALDGAGSLAVVGNGGFSVARLDASTGAEIWTRAVAPGSPSEPSRVAFQGDDVVAAGSVQDPFGSFHATAFKVDGTTGTVQWSYVANDLPPGAVVINPAHALAVDGAFVYLGGSLNNPGQRRDGFVAKLDGASGAEIWRTEFAGPGATDDVIWDIVIDPAGDVLAVGDLGAVRLDPETGAEVWRSSIANGGRRIALDPTGDVIVGGFGFSVSKLVAATGLEQWRTELSGSAVDPFDRLFDVAVDLDGDVIAVGHLENHRTLPDMAVAKLDGDTGVIAWRFEIDQNKSPDVANSVAVDTTGDVIVGGQLSNQFYDRDLAVLKLDGESGSIRWMQAIQGVRHAQGDAALSVVLDGDDDAYVAGVHGEMSVVALDGATGIVGPVGGRKLTVTDLLGLPSRRAITALLAENAIVAPAPGSPDDPTLAGATVRLTNPTTLETAAFTLPAGSAWKGLGSPPGSTGYSFSDKSGASGACGSLRIIPGKSLKVSCNGKLAPIPFSLDEPSQGRLILSVRFGSGPLQCGIFGGEVQGDNGVGYPGAIGRFKAKSAPPTGSCL